MLRTFVDVREWRKPGVIYPRLRTAIWAHTFWWATLLQVIRIFFLIILVVEVGIAKC